MTAQGYVALAKRAGSNWIVDAQREARYLNRGGPSRLYTTTLGNVYLVLRDGVPPSSVAMVVDCTPENTACEEALTRALLASAIKTREALGHFTDDCRVWQASLGDVLRHGGPSRSDARDALLDALLSTTEAGAR